MQLGQPYNQDLLTGIWRWLKVTERRLARLRVTRPGC